MEDEWPRQVFREFESSTQSSSYHHLINQLAMKNTITEITNRC